MTYESHHHLNQIDADCLNKCQKGTQNPGIFRPLYWQNFAATQQVILIKNTTIDIMITTKENTSKVRSHSINPLDARNSLHKKAAKVTAKAKKARQSRAITKLSILQQRPSVFEDFGGLRHCRMMSCRVLKNTNNKRQQPIAEIWDMHQLGFNLFIITHIS